MAQELCLFANGIIDASDEIQCRMAASHLARAVAIIGVEVVLAILLKKAVFTMKSRFKAPEAAPVPALPAQQRATPSQASGRGEVPPAVGQKGGSIVGGMESTAKGVANPDIPKIVRPSVPNGMTPNQFGRDVIGWGSGPEAATARANSVTTVDVSGMIQKGLTKDMATQWRDFYMNDFARNSNNATAGNRAT